MARARASGCSAGAARSPHALRRATHARPASGTAGHADRAGGRRCGYASTGSSRGSSAVAAGTSTRRWLPCWPSSAMPTARAPPSFRRISARASHAWRRTSRPGSLCRAAGACSSCRPRTRWAWPHAGRFAASRHTFTCTSTTRICCPGNAVRRCAPRSRCGTACEVTDLDRLREAANGLPQRNFALH